MVPEYDTWVPYVRDHVSRGAVFASIAAAVVLGILFAPAATMMEAAFFFAIIVAGNAALWKMESWTAVRDRAAIEANVATRGWGIDPSLPLGGTFDRLAVQKEVDAKLREKQQ